MRPARVFEVLLRAALGGLFLYAGLMKLRDPSAFATEIANYRLLSDAASPLAATLPAVEVVLGLALLAAPTPWRRAAALATAGLMAVFTVAVAQVLARGINVDCGCFGGDSGPVTALTVVRDVALLLGALALVVMGRPPKAPPTTPGPEAAAAAPPA